MSFDAIFKAYDIRGTYPDQLHEELAERIGSAFAAFVSKEKILIGHDMRISSAPLMDALIRGIVRMGKDVERVGLIPTDAAYFAAGFYDIPTIMITASHNPQQYNGFKLTDAGAVPIGDESGLKEIRAAVEKNDFDFVN